MVGIQYAIAVIFTFFALTANAAITASCDLNPVTEIIIDNTDTRTEAVGTWLPSGRVVTSNGMYASNYLYSQRHLGENEFIWHVPLLGASTNYEVYAQWPSDASLSAIDATYRIDHDGGTDAVVVNQRENGGQWNLLGTYTFSNALTARVRINDLNTVGGPHLVAADAIRLVPVNNPQAVNACASVEPDPTREVAIVDNDDQGTTQTCCWPKSTAIPGFYGNNYRASSEGTGNARYHWNLPIQGNGLYQVYAQWPGNVVVSSNQVVYNVLHQDGISKVTQNQKIFPGQWNLLGTYRFSDQLPAQVRITNSSMRFRMVAADAIRIVPVRFIQTENAAPVASNVTIVDTNGGEAQLGDTLTGSYTYSDGDNDPEGQTSFRWLRNGVAIAGATEQSYTLVDADIPAQISFEVVPVASAGMLVGEPVLSSPIATVAQANTVPTASNVMIVDSNAGNAVVGDTLTGVYVYADAENDAEGQSSYRWLRDGVTIVGATGIFYTLTAADVPALIVFEVTPVAATGETTGVPVASAAIPTVAVPVNTAPSANNVSIVDANGGNVISGDTLTGTYDYADLEGDAEGASTYRWLRDNVAIPGASQIDYTVTSADVGTTLSFEVTPIALVGELLGLAVQSAGVIVVPASTDTTAPEATIQYPPLKSLTDGERVTVTGTASDADSTITSVQVNGIDVITTDNFATWSVEIPLVEGMNTLTVSTSDSALNTNNNVDQASIERLPRSYYGYNDFVVDPVSGDTFAIMNTSRATLVRIDVTTGAQHLLSFNGTTRYQALAVDAANDRVLALVESSNNINAIKISDGTESTFAVISSETRLNDIALDIQGAQLFASGGSTLYSIDLASNAVSVFSDSTTPGNTVDLKAPTSLGFDANNRILYTIDKTDRALLAVNENGVRSVVRAAGSDTYLQLELTGNPKLGVDPANNRILFNERGSGINFGRNIVAVDTTDGSYSNFFDITSVDPELTYLGKIATDVSGNRVLFTSATANAIFSVDLTSQAVDVVADMKSPDPFNFVLANSYERVSDFAFDATANQFYSINSSTQKLFSIDAITGEARNLFDVTTPQLGQRIEGLVHDPANNRILYTNMDIPGIVAVDMTTGIHTTLSSNTIPNGNNPFNSGVSHMVLDAANNRLIVSDNAFPARLLSVALDTGQRTLIPVGALDIVTSMVLDAPRNRLLVVEGEFSQIVAIDLSNGARTPFWNTSIAGDNSAPYQITLDAANDQIYVLDRATVEDDGLPFVYTINLETGAANITQNTANYDFNFLNAGASYAIQLLHNPNTSELFMWDVNRMLAVETDTKERVVFSQ